MLLNDAHCHFFSTRFFAALGRGLTDSDPASPGARALEILGWDDPGTPEQLADRWVAELDANGVSRAAMIASIPGDASSVAAAVRRHPARLVGFFMVDPTQPDAAVIAAAAIDNDRLRAICLFPAMHRYSLHDDRVYAPCSVSPPRARRRRFSCTVAFFQSGCGRSSVCRARSISASATRSTCTRSRSPIRPCRSSFRISARGFFARR